MINSSTRKKLKENFSLSKEDIEILELICKRKEYQDYFFQTKINPRWFFPLDFLKFFKPERMPLPFFDEKSKQYIFPAWNIMNYIENILKNLNAQEKETYIKKILNIIKDVSIYEDVSGNRLDNPRVWWQFIKILSNIAKNYIDDEIIDMIPFWLNSKFGSELVGIEIITSLIPNLLEDNPRIEDCKKVEKIIKIITELLEIPLDQDNRKKLKKMKKYRFKIDAYWIKKLFEDHYEILGKYCSNEFITDLIENIKNILTKKYEIVLLNIENKKDYLLVLIEKKNKYILKIFNSKGINPGLLLGYDLEYLSKETDLLKEFRYKKGTWFDFVKEASIDLQKTNLFSNVSPHVIKKYLVSLFRNLYCEGTYKSFYEEDINNLEPLNILAFVLKKVLLIKVKFDLIEMKNLLKSLIKEKHLFFTKMALFIFGQNMDELSDLFWKIIENNRENIFFEEEIYFGDELKKVLENLKFYSEEQKEIIHNIIESGPKYYIPEDGQKKFIRLWKQKRYQALSHHQFFHQLYEKYKKETGVDIALEPAIGKVEVFWASDRSPLTKDVILELPNNELIQFFLDFKPKRRLFDEHTPKGLAEEFEKAVEEQPNKYLQNMSSMLQVGYIYIDALLKGIEKANKNHKAINWPLVLNFIKSYIKRDCFWKNELKIPNDNWEVDYNWVIKSICSLFDNISKDNVKQFSEDLFNNIEGISLYILDNLKFTEKEQDIDDYLIYSINSSLGKILETLILFYYRISTNKKNINGIKKNFLPVNFKSRYEKLLQLGSIEAHTIFGYHLYYLFYLEENWVVEKIMSFNSIPDDLWEAFMSGYLNLSINKIMESLYKRMKESANYFRGINYSFKNEDNEKVLIHHITLGYIHGLEDISKTSLFGILIAKAVKERDYSQIDYVVESLYSLKNFSIDTEKQNKIIEFWEHLYNIFKKKTKLNDSEKNIISSLSNLTIYLSEINENNVEMISLSATYLNKNYFNSSSLIESLDKLKDKGNVEFAGENIGKILLKIVNSSIPIFQENRIISIVKYLYSTKNGKLKDMADKICNSYAQKGFLFLKDIYKIYK